MKAKKKFCFPLFLSLSLSPSPFTNGLVTTPNYKELKGRGTDEPLLAGGLSLCWMAGPYPLK